MILIYKKNLKDIIFDIKIINNMSKNVIIMNKGKMILE
jgi:hypothetical protein